LASVGGSTRLTRPGFQRGFGHEGFAQQQRLGRAVVAEHLRHQQAGRGLGHRPRFTKGMENAALSPA
jgi:hypothetical protein